MTNQYPSGQYATGPQLLRISAGTAVKIGFFGSLGALLFSLILSQSGSSSC